MKTVRTGILAGLLAVVLTGCGELGISLLGSSISTLTSLSPAYKSSSQIDIEWTSRSLRTLSLEYSHEGGDWQRVAEDLPPAGHYSWSLLHLAPGTYQVRLFGQEGGAVTTLDLGSFIVDDEAPVAGVDQSVPLTEDTVANFVLNTPTENDQYTVVLVSPPARGSLSGCANSTVSLTCQYTPFVNVDNDDVFTYKIVDRAGNESAVRTVTLDISPVNDAPLLTTLMCASIAPENHTYSCSMSAEDVDQPSIVPLNFLFGTGHTCPAWLTIDATTGEVSGIPLLAHVGSACQAVVVVEDQDGALSNSFTWTVAVEDAPPVIHVTAGPFSIAEDSALTEILTDLNVSSIDEGLGIYSLVPPAGSGDRCMDHVASPAATNLTIDPSSGAVNFRPTPDYAGVCHLRIALTDSLPVTGYADVAVTVTNVQDIPTLSANLSPCSAAAEEDVPYSCSIVVTDPDAESLTISRPGDTCTWLSISPSADGRLIDVSGTPDNSDVGICNLVLTATDSASATGTGTLAIAIANAAPTLSIGVPATLTEDDPAFTGLVTVLSAADVESVDEGFGTYSLNYSGLSGVACNHSTVVANPATDLSIDAGTGELAIRPRADYAGTCYVKIQFDDGNGAGNSVASSEVAINITGINDAPVITAAPTDFEILLSPSGTTAASFSLDVNVGPADEQTQTLSLHCTNSNSERLTVDCSGTRVGSGSLSVNLSATSGLDATSTVTVQVQDSGGNADRSTIVSVNVRMTDAVVLSPIVADALNYNIYDTAVAEFGNTVASSARTFVVTVNAGVKVHSSDPALPALTTGGLNVGARVRIINHGQIIGSAGAGASATTPPGPGRMGQHGGTAIKIQALYSGIEIINNGFIFGGGGGGGRGGTDNFDSPAGGASGAGEGPTNSAVSGSAGALSGGAGGSAGTNISGGASGAGNYVPSYGFASSDGVAGKGGDGCYIGPSYGNNAAEAQFGRGGYGAGFGGGAGGCSLSYAGGGGGGYFGGGFGAGGLSAIDGEATANLNPDVNGYNGGNGGAAIEVPTSVADPEDINVTIVAQAGSQIAGCVWNDISQRYHKGSLVFSSTGSEPVNNPSGLRPWHNGRGMAYR